MKAEELNERISKIKLFIKQCNDFSKSANNITKKIKVILDDAKIQVEGHSDLCNHYSKAISKYAPNPMYKYSVKNYKEIVRPNGICMFSAIIYKDKRPVLYCINNDWGGCNEYIPIITALNK